jgi:2-dehydropantoate 2-reductase
LSVKVGVFGAGAIGGIVAAYLARAEADVVLVDPWFQHVETIRESGLRLESIEETFVAHPRALHLGEIASAGKIDIAVVATKSYDTAWMATLVASCLVEDGTVLSAQNGMNEPTIARVLGEERTIGCVVPMSAEMREPGSVRRTSNLDWGSLILGDLAGGAGSRVMQTAAALEPVTGVATTDDIAAALWGKMTLNVMGNVLAGLTGYTTRRLWTDSDALDVQIALAREVTLLAHDSGVTPDPVLRTLTQEILLNAETVGDPSWLEAKRCMTEAGEARTGKKENVPSLLQDIRKGRRTEVSQLNGWVLDESKSRGREAPVNAAVAAAGRDIELAHLTSDPANVPPLHAVVQSVYGALSAGRPG